LDVFIRINSWQWGRIPTQSGPMGETDGCALDRAKCLMFI